jgi:phosphatidylinositol alpha-mannosyltransferase
MMPLTKQVHPKVLIVTTEAPDLLTGGLGFLNDLLWTELKKRNYPFATCFLTKDKKKVSQWADFTVPVQSALPFDMSLESKAINQAWSTRNLMRQVFAHFQPDIISVNENWAFLPFYFMADQVQLTLVSSHIGLESPLSRTHLGFQNYWDQKIAVSRAQSLVLHSEWAHQKVRTLLTGQIATPFVFPLGVRFDDYAARKVRHPEGKIVVSFFGRHSDSAKNFPAFHEAIRRLPSSHRQRLEVRMYGPDEMTEDFRRDGFKGMSFVQGEAKKQAYSETDIVVMPSVAEHFGIVGLEALLSNCKLIATPGLGMDAFLEPSGSCASDPNSLAQLLMHDIENFEVIRARQEANYYRNFAMRPEFDVSTMTDRYIAIWQAMATQRQSARAQADASFQIKP